MPAYNASRFVHDAISSVIKQTYQKWELLIIDDGSTDNTKEIIFSFDDPRIRYFHQHNAGVSAARNVGLTNMQGDYFCFLDADDVFPEKSLEARLEVFTSNIHFVDGRVLIYNEDLTTVTGIWSPDFRGNAFPRLIHLDEKCFFGCTWMVKVEKGFNYQFEVGMKHGEDLFFYMTIANQGLYSFTETNVLCNRRNSTSAMNNLVGLGKGYAQLLKKINENFKISFGDKALLFFKTRKIMFLSFVAARQYKNAVNYLIFGG